MENYTEICSTVQALDENDIVEKIEKGTNIRELISALLDMGYILDNYDMTSANEYPFLPGYKNGIKLTRVNGALQNKFLGASSL